MRDLKQYIKESILTDFETLSNNDNIIFREAIVKFIKDTYATPSASKFRISKKPKVNGKYLVNVSGNVTLKNPSDTEYLTNGLFEFGKVDGDFIIMNYQNGNRGILKSLEGSPREITGLFRISEQQLTSLKGRPESVGRLILCNLDITTLKDSPKEIYELYISNTKIKNFEGLPKRIDGNFTCTSNPELVSLEGLPKRVWGQFTFVNNGKFFDLDTIKNYTDADWYCIE